MMTCPVCKEEMHAYNIRIRKHLSWKYRWVGLGYAMVCVADPVHSVDLLLYDVWP